MRPLPCCLLLLGCAAADAPDPSERLPLDATLALDLAMGDADSVVVGRLQDATRLADGRIAMLDLDRRAIVFVRADGATLATVGRQGSGPGEFTFPMHLGRCAADSLYVWDMAQARITLLGPDGTFSRVVRAPVAAAFQPQCLPDGRFVMLDASKAMGAPVGRDDGAPLLEGTLLVVSPDGDSLAGVPDQPLGRPRVIGDLAGLAVAGDRLVLGLNSSPTLRSFDLSATPVAADSMPVAPVPFAEERYNAVIDQIVGRMGGDSTQRAGLRRMILSEGKPEWAPLFTAMHGTPDGTVWWVTSLPVDSATTLLGLRPGTPLRTLTLPPGIEVFEMGRDYLLGKRTDDEGFEHLVVYRWDG